MMVHEVDKVDFERWDALPFYDQVRVYAEIIAEEIEHDIRRVGEEV